MNEKIIFRILNSKDSMYDLCENMEQVYDNFYEPLYVEYQELQKILMNNLSTIRELEKNQNSVLQQENKQLKDNWNKLKEWCKGVETNEFNYNFLVVTIKDLLDKIQELEKGDSNE